LFKHCGYFCLVRCLEIAKSLFEFGVFYDITFCFFLEAKPPQRAKPIALQEFVKFHAAKSTRDLFQQKLVTAELM
jgi:hypothetical protein